MVMIGSEDITENTRAWRTASVSWIWNLGNEHLGGLSTSGTGRDHSDIPNCLKVNAFRSVLRLVQADVWQLEIGSRSYSRVQQRVPTPPSHARDAARPGVPGAAASRLTCSRMGWSRAAWDCEEEFSAGLRDERSGSRPMSPLLSQDVSAEDMVGDEPAKSFTLMRPGAPFDDQGTGGRVFGGLGLVPAMGLGSGWSWLLADGPGETPVKTAGLWGHIEGHDGGERRSLSAEGGQLKRDVGHWRV
ncbi:hypothetical protein JB92DRAFT_2826012 [Gautieria morchelliformis]|nr:hypothetical protein JB92DRAFT_2826012 [Gautieria morchelliformis]